MRACLASLVLLGLSASSAAAQDEAPFITGTPRWLERPSEPPSPYPRRRTELPPRALAVLDCLVAEDGTLACFVRSEAPPGSGFGEYALRITRHCRMAPTTVEGEPTAHRRYRMRVYFDNTAE